MDKETFSFNRQQQPETLPLDPASMKMIAFAVSPKYEFGGDGAERKQAVTKDGLPKWQIRAVLLPEDGLPKWQIRAVLLPEDGGEGDTMTINYASAEKPQASGPITFGSMRVRVWFMPERNSVGISIFGTELRSLGSSPAVADEGEVEL